MINSLSHYLNRKLLVSMPSIFEDGRPRDCTLTGIEASGLWLESADLVQKLSEHHGHRPASSIFVPFAQIAFVADPGATTPRHHAPAPERETSATEKRRERAKIRKKKPRAT
jgi:hypothetical protein